MKGCGEESMLLWRTRGRICSEQAALWSEAGGAARSQDVRRCSMRLRGSRELSENVRRRKHTQLTYGPAERGRRDDEQ